MKGIRGKMKITAEVFSLTKWKQRIVFFHATMMAGSTECFWSCPTTTTITTTTTTQECSVGFR